jgi:hypothetical protein
MEVLSIAATAARMMGAIGATAAELPTYEVLGFPITSHQLVMWGPADAQESVVFVKADSPID